MPAPDPGAETWRPASGVREALHFAGLWALAVVQPLFDLLSRSPEFFVAHDTRPGDLLGLVALLCLAVPAGWLAVLRLCRLGGPRLHATPLPARAAAARAVGLPAGRTRRRMLGVGVAAIELHGGGPAR